MELISLDIQWRSGARVHHLSVDAAGVVYLDPPGVDAAPEGAALPLPVVAPAVGAARRGKAWSDAEEDLLREGFAAAEPPAELARRLGRSRGAVVARLVRLGLIDEAEAGLRYPVHRPGAAAPATPDAPATPEAPADPE